MAGAVATSLRSRERIPDLWSEKTTVCRIFSCQRSSGGHIAPRKLTVARGAFPRTPFAHSLAGPHSPAPFVRALAGMSGASPLDQPSYPMDPGRESQAGPLNSCSGHSGLSELPRNQPESLARRGRGPPPSTNAGGICQPKLVENTGLEPVTSWLQTRRSPS